MINSRDLIYTNILDLTLASHNKVNQTQGGTFNERTNHHYGLK